jgi:hypothetical protein
MFHYGIFYEYNIKLYKDMASKYYIVIKFPIQIFLILITNANF